MSETQKRKPFDMTSVLTKAVQVDKVPSITHRGKSGIDWKPLLKTVQQKGIIRLSEKDIVIGSVLNGVKKEAIRQNVDVGFSTRKIDGVIYLFIQRTIKR